MRSLLAIGIVLLAAAPAMADQIWIGRLSAQDVTVRGVENGELVYFTGGRERRTPLDEVVRLEVDGQQQLNDAEAAYQNGNWQAAATAYDRVLSRRGDEAWVRRRATLRLIETAAKAGLFPEAAGGYVALVNLDPAAAAGRQPDPAASGVTGDQLTAARGRVRDGLSVAGNNADARRQLLTFLLQLDNAAGDARAAANTIEQLGSLVGEVAPDDPAQWPTFARVTLGRAEAALAAGDAQRAASLVSDNGRVFATPSLVAESLLLLARVAETSAEDGPREAKLDAAYAYLRAAANAPESPAIAAQAMVAAGDLHRDLGLADDAADLYRAAASRYPDAPAAAEAQERLAATEQP